MSKGGFMGSMFMNKEKVMEQVKNLPPGKKSASRHYWCMTCKMLFLMDEPVCPFMSKVCINTPIAVETMPPDSTASIEKFGLFYPKIPQIIMARLANETEPGKTAEAWVDEYLDFLDEWSFDMKSTRNRRGCRDSRNRHYRGYPLRKVFLSDVPEILRVFPPARYDNLPDYGPEMHGRPEEYRLYLVYPEGP